MPKTDRRHCSWPAHRTHGTAGAFRNGCRCPEAREAWRLYTRRRRQGRGTGSGLVDAIGTARRLQALATMGYTQADLAAAMGWKGVQMVARSLKAHRVARSTAERVSAAYERLSMKPGPSPRAAKRARHAGWAPPLAWDEGRIDDPTAKPTGIRKAEGDRGRRRVEVDASAVVRAMAGDTAISLTVAERATAIATLVRRGHTDEEISHHLGMTIRTISRIRVRDGIAPGVRHAAVPQARLDEVLRAAAA